MHSNPKSNIQHPKSNRVLLMNTSAAVGGTARVIQNLTRGLTARGVSVRAVFPMDPQSGDLLAWFRQAGVEAETHPAILPMEAPHTWRDVQNLRRLVRRSGAAVVSLHYGLSYI